MLTRRQVFLATGAAGAALVTATPPRSQTTSKGSPRIHEITMAAPDIVCVELRDAPMTHGSIVPLQPPAVDSKQGEWIESNGVWGRVIGPKKEHYRTSDKKPAFFIDREIVDNPGSYPQIGGRTVQAVFRKSVPYDAGVYRSANGDHIKGSSLKHYVYLKFDGRLPQGQHALAVSDYVRPTPFMFDDKATRAISIRANQHGHRPGDLEKLAYLALWLPGGPDDGAFSFELYGLGKFNIIDADAHVVFTGEIVLRLGPKEVESSENGLLTYEHEDGATYTANRSGTYVYGLDYGRWSGASEGFYRIQIPGLGVSDPFLVSESAWYGAAKVCLSGLYHHRSGIHLDGRFGYTRPVNHHPGVTGPVFNSKMPYLFGDESPFGFIPYVHAASGPWITAEISPEAWGGYMDAGDWDRRIDHLQVTNGLLLVHELLPEGARNISWGIPKCSECLDPSLYRSMDALPDLLHEAAFGLDIYRRMQDARTGAVRGGVESGGGPAYGEASFFDSHTVFAYAPDHQSAWRYAAAAARFARVLAELKKDELARVYRISAEKAFVWAEEINANIDEAYAEAIRIANAAGAFKDKPWAVHKASIVGGTRGARASAAAALYRLSREARYGEIFEELFAQVNEQDEGGDARWDYAHTPQPGGRINKGKILDYFVGVAQRYITDPQGGRTNYKSTKWRSIPMWWGQGNAPDYNQTQILLRAHARTDDPRFLRCMQAAMAGVFGANQVGICMTTGLGHRNVKHPLHEDHMAVDVPVPSGITVYGYGAWQRTDYRFVWGNHFWAALPNASGISGQPDYEDARKRRVHPFRKSLPLYEYFIEHPLMIMQQEYTVPQTINTTSMMALYLHGYDGNTAT